MSERYEKRFMNGKSKVIGFEETVSDDILSTIGNSVKDFVFENNKMVSVTRPLDKINLAKDIPEKDRLKRIQVEIWSEEKQEYSKHKNLSRLFNIVDAIPRKKERVFLKGETDDMIFVVDEVDYTFSKKHFTLTIYISEI